MRIYPNTTVDYEFQQLGSLGHSGSLNDRQFSFLRTSGYRGALADMLAQYSISSLRLIATDARTMDQITPATTQGFFRTHHRARDNITSMQLEFPNWYATSVEVAPASAATIYAAVEYPIGAAPVRIYFGGLEQGTIPAGGVLLSDPLSITIPNGAEFAVKTFFESASGIISTVLKGNQAKEKWQGGTGALTDQTMTATQPMTFSTLTYGPSAIIGMSAKPAFFLFGDSRVAGSGDTAALEFKGELERTIGPSYAFVNAGRAGLNLGPSGAVLSNARRVALSEYCTHILSNVGINDISGGRTSAQFIADLQTFAGAFSKPFYQATISPRSTSTDGWVTTANQTTDVMNAQRTAANDLIRAGVTGLAGYVEGADVMESARNSGIWKAGYTSDGTHANATGYAALEATGVIDPLS